MQFLSFLQGVQYHQYQMVSIILPRYENVLLDHFPDISRDINNNSYFPEAILILDFLLRNLDGPLKGLSLDGWWVSAALVYPTETKSLSNWQTFSLEHHRDSYLFSISLNHWLICSWSASRGQILKLERPINQFIFFEQSTIIFIV